MKKDDEIGTVKSAAQKEMKTVSSLLKNTYRNAFATKKIQAAVKRVAIKEDRSKSLIIFGLPETEEKLDAQVSGILLDHLKEKLKILSCKRVGKDTSEPTSLASNTDGSLCKGLCHTSLKPWSR